ncbi:hypothetical protein LEN26_020166 [Aphanomyces euteiches]|nr:hypothetical protein LEN26_020166 [Aphanomyces euteiches]KAH9129500.1 hypothetical protein AeMF1_000477 [Aphanomyces euteiches]KAH9192072.1 hypothetical protein AeNC1_005957 [Aphanomyces euteiches]
MDGPETTSAALSSGGSTAAPLMTRFELAREEEAELHDHIRSKVQDLFAATSELSPTSSWKPTKSPSILECLTPSRYSVRSSATIRASPSIVLQLLDGGTSIANYRTALRSMYQHTFADTNILFHHQRNAHESLAVQWTAFRCHNPLLRDVDLCCAEYIHATSDAAVPLGNQEDAAMDPRHCVGYKVCSSIESKRCPSLVESHQLDRISCPLAGFVLFPTEVLDVTKVVFTMSVATMSPTRDQALRRLLLFLAAALPRLQQTLDAIHLSPTSSLSLTHPRPKAKEDDEPTTESPMACQTCARLFSHRRRRQECHLCGLVLCHLCAVVQDTSLPSVGQTRMRLCSSCAEQTRPPPPPPRARILPTSPPSQPQRSTTSLSEEQHGRPRSHAAAKLQLDLDLVHQAAAAPSPAASATASPARGSATAAPLSPAFPSPLAKQSRFMKPGAGFAMRHPSSPVLPSPSKRTAIPMQAVLQSPLRKKTSASLPPVTSLLNLCERASQLYATKFAGLVVTSNDRVEHLLYVRGSGKLLPAPVQLGICQPVLSAQGALAVGNVLQDQPPSSVAIDWAKLPIVMGPQKARFYVGVPLVSSSGLRRDPLGALCVFDATPREVATADALESLAALAVTSFFERDAETKRTQQQQRHRHHPPRLDSPSLMSSNQDSVQV